MPERYSLDPRLAKFVVVTEMADPGLLAEPVLQRKYRVGLPDDGRHIVGLVAIGQSWLPAFYVNYLPHRNAMLIRAACTDGEVLRQLDEEKRAALREADGLMLQAVAYAETRFADISVATFGYCGDARSWSILERCGYVRIPDHRYLIVRWNREPRGRAREALLDSVRNYGEF